MSEPADALQATTDALDAIRLASAILLKHRPALAALDEAARRHESIGAILQPTLYRETLGSPNYATNVAAARDALRFLEAVDRWHAAHGIRNAALDAQGTA